MLVNSVIRMPMLTMISCKHEETDKCWQIVKQGRKRTSRAVGVRLLPGMRA
jgi:hypothetical protein